MKNFVFIQIQGMDTAWPEDRPVSAVPLDGARPKHRPRSGACSRAGGCPRPGPRADVDSTCVACSARTSCRPCLSFPNAPLGRLLLTLSWALTPEGGRATADGPARPQRRLA